MVFQLSKIGAHKKRWETSVLNETTVKDLENAARLVWGPGDSYSCTYCRKSRLLVTYGPPARSPAFSSDTISITKVQKGQALHANFDLKVPYTFWARLWLVLWRQHEANSFLWLFASLHSFTRHRVLFIQIPQPKKSGRAIFVLTTRNALPKDGLNEIPFNNNARLYFLFSD